MFVILLLAVGCLGTLGTSSRCVDEDGNMVDWFYLYKLPKENKHPNPLIKRGVAYMYITSTTLKQGWIMSKIGIKNSNSIPARTLAPMYENPEIMSLIYNDQPPVSRKAVTKPKPNNFTDFGQRTTSNSPLQRSHKRFKRTAIYTTQIPTKLAYTKLTTFTEKNNHTTLNIYTTKPNKFVYKGNTSTLYYKEAKPTRHALKGYSMYYKAQQTTSTTSRTKPSLFTYKANSFTPSNKINSTTFPKFNKASLKNSTPYFTQRAKLTTTKRVFQKNTQESFRLKTNSMLLYKANATKRSYGTTRRITRKPVRKSSVKGFTKGVILGDHATGVWMVHSVAKFPPRPNVSDFNATYSFPLPATKFGQLFFCVTVATPTLDQIALQLKYKEPLVVSHNVPESLKRKLPNLVDVTNNKTIDEAPWYRLHTFKSLAGREFLSFAKNGKFKADLYSGLVANTLKSDLFVESWLNGPGVLGSECSDSHQVYNVEQVRFSRANIVFTSMFDQSKWTVTTSLLSPKQRSNNTRHWICVGDTNRVALQESRGGGTVCTSEPTLWEHFAQLISSIKPCMNSLKYYN